MIIDIEKCTTPSPKVSVLANILQHFLGALETALLIEVIDASGIHEHAVISIYIFIYILTVHEYIYRYIAS